MTNKTFITMTLGFALLAAPAATFAGPQDKMDKMDKMETKKKKKGKMSDDKMDKKMDKKMGKM